MKLERKAVPSLVFIMTDHSVLRMKERMPDNFTLPVVGSYVRLLTMRDTYHNKNLIVLRVKGGAIIGKWNRKHLIIVTMFSEEAFHKFQLRQKSRFIPLETACYQVTEIMTPVLQRAAVANVA